MSSTEIVMDGEQVSRYGVHANSEREKNKRTKTKRGQSEGNRKQVKKDSKRRRKGIKDEDTAA